MDQSSAAQQLETSVIFPISETILNEKPLTSNQEEAAISPFLCLCSICERQRKGKMPSLVLQSGAEDLYAKQHGQKKSFTWVLEKLGEISGLTIVKFNIPETVVYRKGATSFMVVQNRDNSLRIINSKSRLRNSEIQKAFSMIAKQRKKEATSHQMKGSKTLNFDIFDQYGKETVLVRYMSSSKENFPPFDPSDEEGPLRVMVEQEFANLMYERGGSVVWKTISYIQTAVKCKLGISQTIEICYYFSDDVKNMKQPNLEFEIYEEELGITDHYEYCLLQCKKLAFFLYVFCHKKLLKIDAEFIRDDNGKIWFVYAAEIFLEDRDILEDEKELLFKHVDLGQQSNTEVSAAIQIYRDKKVKFKHELRMESRMEEYYQSIKDKLGISSLLENPE